MAIDKDLKELATTILKLQGKDHDAWLTEKYQNEINANAKLITQALKTNVEVQK